MYTYLLQSLTTHKTWTSGTLTGKEDIDSSSCSLPRAPTELLAILERLFEVGTTEETDTPNAELLCVTVEEAGAWFMAVLLLLTFKLGGEWVGGDCVWGECIGGLEGAWTCTDNDVTPDGLLSVKSLVWAWLWNPASSLEAPELNGFCEYAWGEYPVDQALKEKGDAPLPPNMYGEKENGDGLEYQPGW